MAKIIPFQGVVYNKDKIDDMASVTTPPYDVISSKERDDFYERHPQNIIRLILNRAESTDSESDNPHTRAAANLNNWLSDGVLVRDEEPAFYLTAVDFEAAGRTFTRYGLIAAVGLEPFDKGVILPHETTFSKVKSERLGLIQACKANLSCIFSIYSDKENVLETLKAAALENDPDMDFVDTDGLRQRLWKIVDKEVQARVITAMEKRRLYIADGHHRYETALNYRDRLKNNSDDFSDDHPANFIMMYLCSMEDPGMIILPAHRLLPEIDNSKIESFIEKAETCFNITTIGFNEGELHAAGDEFITSLRMKSATPTIGVFMKDTKAFYQLTVKPGIMDEMFGNELHASLRELDVTVLTRLILKEILGFDQEMLDDKKQINFVSDDNLAIDKISSGESKIAFILNSTRMEQVQRVAEAGYTMPRKSTYFYPKVITGQVINKLS
ncbi:MAG: DUF1015 domain-containing protein [Desulfobacterales bacterium]|nr:DUF1015 domain-containing protein [Desulfobacterales bacterium]